MGEFYEKLSAFLTAYGCVDPNIMEGTLEERFKNPDNRDYLLKVIVAKKLASKAPHMLSQTADAIVANENANVTEDSIVQHEITTYLRKACIAMNMSRPPKDISTEKLLDCLRAKIEQKLKKCPKNYLGEPLLPKKGLDERQWSIVHRLVAVLQQEFNSRRGTLLKRLDVTVQSFKWSDKAKKKLEAIAAVYAPLRQAMNDSLLPGIPHLLAARDTLLRIEKTSGASRRRYTACELNRILIGRVPDRGGRAWELEPPPPEVPNFQPRQQQQQHQNRGDRGGFHNNNNYDQSKQNYNQRGYHDSFAKGNAMNQAVAPVEAYGGYNQYRGDQHSGGLVFRSDPVDPNSFSFTYQPTGQQGGYQNGGSGAYGMSGGDNFQGNRGGRGRGRGGRGRGRGRGRGGY